VVGSSGLVTALGESTRRIGSLRLRPLSTRTGRTSCVSFLKREILVDPWGLALDPTSATVRLGESARVISTRDRHPACVWFPEAPFIGDSQWKIVAPQKD